MNRRTFAQALAVGALGAAVPPLAGAASPLAAAASQPASAQAAAPAATPDPQYGLSVMLWTVFHDLPFEERIAKVAEAGYSRIQFVGEYHKWSPADFDRAIAARNRLGMEFDTTAGLKSSIGDPAVRDAFLADVAHELTLMEKLSCPALIVMSGNVVPGLSREAQHASCIEGLKQAAKLVEGRQINGQPVRLLLECIDPEENPKYFLTSAAEAIEVIRAVNHPQVQFLYDMFHEQIAEGNLIEKLDKHIDVIGLIHVADVPGRHEPGTGEINYGNVYKKLAQLNYRHNIAMEFMPLGDQVAKLKVAKAQAMNPGAV
jgi:hydroxypyruvate isomerase